MKSLLIILSLLIPISAIADQAISDCSQLKKGTTAYTLHYENCQSAMNFVKGVSKLVTTLTGQQQRALNFQYYIHSPTGKDKYQNQTPNPCCTAMRPTFANWMDRFFEKGYKNPGGPMCVMLRYNQSIAEYTPQQQLVIANNCVEHLNRHTTTKQPIKYFNALISQPSLREFGNPLNFAWKQSVGLLGASINQTFDSMIQLPPANEHLYYTPNAPYLTNRVNKPYYGSSGGGGSGAGFEVFRNAKGQKQTLISGGFGGGAGMTSQVGSGQGIQSGAGGGGGIQFNNNNAYMKQKYNYDSVGLGAGTSSNEQYQPNYSYYYNGNDVKFPIQQRLAKITYSNALKQIRSNNQPLTIQGGGGFGAGFEFLKANGEEHTPHAYSTGGGFQFTLAMLPQQHQLIASNMLIANIDQNIKHYFQNSYIYWTNASSHKYNKAFKNVTNGGWNNCPISTSNLQYISTFCQAFNFKQITQQQLKLIPNYMRINYQGQAQDQGSCKYIPPLSSNITAQTVNSICQNLKSQLNPTNAP